MQLLALSGYEVTDIERSSNRTKGVSDSGFMADAFLKDGSIGIRRAATNLFPNGQNDATTYWNTSGGGVVSRAIDTGVPAPFSPQSIKYTLDGTAQQGIQASSAAGQAAAAGTAGVASVWFMGVASQQYIARAKWNNTDASVTEGTDATFTATGEWQLVSAPPLAVAAGKTGDTLNLRVLTTTARAETMWAAHAMLETASVVAPYVATSGGATATHPAGRVQAPASLLNATQGWVAARVRHGTPSTNTTEFNYVLAFGTADDQQRIGLRPNNGHWLLFDGVSGAVVAQVQVNATYASGDIATVVAAWDASKLYLSINGSAFVSVNRATIPSGTFVFDIGSQRGVSNWFNGDIFWFACGTGTLTDADAARIATCTSGSPRAYIGAAAQMTACFPQPGIGELVPPVILVP